MKKSVQVLLLITVLVSALVFGPYAAFSQQAASPASQEPIPTMVINSLSRLFMPLIKGGQVTTRTIAGQVVDANKQPVAEVTVTDNSGKTTKTDAAGKYEFKDLADGIYAVSPSKNGMIFSPAMIQVNVPHGELKQDFVATAANAELIVNSGFENYDAWELPASEYPAAYSTDANHTPGGARSMRTGILPGGYNRYSYSSARQLVTIPANNTYATLRLWIYPITSDLNTESASGQPQFTNAADAYDTQYVLVLDANNNLLETLFWARSNLRQWMQLEFNLAKYIGRTIKIQVGTYNDGYDGVTAMYVDDVSLEVSNTPSPVTPTPTPTTYSPTDCTTNRIANYSFEYYGNWTIKYGYLGTVPFFPANYTTEAAHTGARSMRTGILNLYQSMQSYSEAYQTVYIPADANYAAASMWLNTTVSPLNGYAPDSGELPARPEIGKPFDPTTLGNSLQYVLIEDLNFNVIGTLVWEHTNDRAWKQIPYFDLSSFKGKYVNIVVGAYNKGGNAVTAMFVDDVYLFACNKGGPTPTATSYVPPTATFTPGPTPTFTPTSVPPVCSERLGNNSFEYYGYWQIPATAFSAGYSSYVAHTGLWSMRTGIPYGAYNRYSYSDAYQVASIPWSTRYATLSMWQYPISSEYWQDVKVKVGELELSGAQSYYGDVQYLLVLDSYGNWIDTLLWQRSNSQVWSQQVFDVSRYIGTTIRLQFGTYNDGYNGVTSMYVDDMSLQACP